LGPSWNGPLVRPWTHGVGVGGWTRWSGKGADWARRTHFNHEKTHHTENAQHGSQR
jgi:hypothetical protein